MNRGSTTTTTTRHHHVRDLTSLSDDQAEFVRLCMRYYSLREDEVLAACKERHGSFEAAFDKGYAVLSAIHKEEEEMLQKARETLPPPIFLGVRFTSYRTTLSLSHFNVPAQASLTGQSDLCSPRTQPEDPRLGCR